MEKAFDDMDKKLEQNTFQGKHYKVVKSSQARLSIKALRTQYIDKVSHIGEDND